MVAVLGVDEENERLEAQICTLAGQIARATCEFVLLAAELDRRAAWGAWGCQSMAHWLSWKCGLSLVTARQYVRVGLALDDFPIDPRRVRIRATELFEGPGDGAHREVATRS